MVAHWTHEEDALLRQGWLAGDPIWVIATRLGFGKNRVEQRAHRMGLGKRVRLNHRLTGAANVIRCLSCSRPFESEDRRANRICLPCKGAGRFSHDGAAAYRVAL